VTIDLLIAGTRGLPRMALTHQESQNGPVGTEKPGPGRVGAGGGVERCSSVAGCLLGVLSA
jgi:hypothetical protein